MSKTSDRLALLLDTPFLARIVPHLAPETLHQLVQYRGLDACAGLVTAATPAQLTSLLDLDLWCHPQPGTDERFDVDRFGEWLEVLVDAGDAIAARTVAALDESLVVAGLSRYVRVFDIGTFEPTESTDDEPLDRHDMMNSETRADVVEGEIGGYLLRGRRADAWDAILALLAALETGQNRYFHAVMQGCRRLSNSRPEIDGLDDLLTAPEQQLYDLAVERDRRRSRQGYATAADARAFLRMARQPQCRDASVASAAPLTSSSAPRSPVAMGINPIATAYFRDAQEDGCTIPTSDRPSPQAQEYGVDGTGRGEADLPPLDILEVRDAVVELLTEAGMMPVRSRALPAAAADDHEAGPAGLPLLRPLMEFVQHHDQAAYFTRTSELAFLANTLLAGCSVQSRPFAPQEASDAAASICNLGLEHWPMRWAGTTPRAAWTPRELDDPAPRDAFLVEHDLVTAFEVGWSVLHKDVGLFAADQLVSILSDIHCLDGEILRGLRTLRRTLAEQRAAGTPWLARDAADVLAMLDGTAWIGVLGLLDECPILPAALTAVLARRKTSVSPTAFSFISTSAQIGDIRVFMSMLPRLLSA